MRKFSIFLLISNLLILDGAAVYLALNRSDIFPKTAEVKVADVGQIEDKLSDDCGENCKRYVDNKISEGLTRVTLTPLPTKSSDVVKNTPTKTKVKNVTYVPIPGSGNTTNTNWNTLAGTDFYLSKNDYAGLVGVYFEANMKLTNGNGAAYLRLFDITHSVGVSGSEISTSSQSSTFVSSGAISLWEGYNHYVVQAKTLTADTAVFESGKLKIITEN